MYKASDERHNRGVSSCGTPQSLIIVVDFHSILFYILSTGHFAFGALRGGCQRGSSGVVARLERRSALEQTASHLIGVRK